MSIACLTQFKFQWYQRTRNVFNKTVSMRSSRNLFGFHTTSVFTLHHLMRLHRTLMIHVASSLTLPFQQSFLCLLTVRSQFFFKISPCFSGIRYNQFRYFVFRHDENILLKIFDLSLLQLQAYTFFSLLSV